MLILDEDMEGNITLDEFYNALEAYGCSGEKHWPTDGTDYYVGFEHKAMFKLLTILKDRNITYQELFRSCDVNNDGDVNIKELEAVLTGFSAEFYQKDTQAIHNFFDIDKNNSCTEAEFMTQLAKAERLHAAHKERMANGRPGTAGGLRGTMTGGFNDREVGMNVYISGYNESSPRSQQDKMSEYLCGIFREKGILPARVFSMADSRRSGEVVFAKVLEDMCKIMPSLQKDFVDNIPGAFGLSKNDMISKSDFDMMFDMKAAMNHQVGPQTSALKKKNQADSKDTTGNAEILKYLAECLAKENLTAIRLFKMADTNFNQVLTIEELKEQVKKTLPDYFQGLNFKKLLKAFDINGNGVVEQTEFVSLVEGAAASNAITIKYSKMKTIIGGDKGGEAKNTIKYQDTVAPEDRVTHEQVIKYLKDLVTCENRVDDPIDDIQLIFEKIQAWKQKAGDLEK